MNDGNYLAIRAARRAGVPEPGPLEGVVWEERFIPGPEGAPEVRVLVYRPEAAVEGRPAILHLHGGGLVLGCPEQVHERNGWLVRELGCVIVSVDYRKAPEDPFPAGPEDGWATLVWMRDQAGALGIDAGSIAILGESAGGLMAATLAIIAHERGGGPAPVFQGLVYPMLDDRTGQDAIPEDQECHVWTETSNRWAWRVYLGTGPGETPPDGAVPARRADLSGLPPAWIGVGSVDLFVGENLDYAKRLLAAGVECEVTVVPGGCHAFQRIAPEAKITRDFEASYMEALRRAFRKAQAG
ncbi:hypothetical protein ATO6_19635 [Oceanicola sp. 22II-s10i]|nr:hypothetical protein ATO6_19635 [Oceanicola sp. 22II-s10i]